MVLQMSFTLVVDDFGIKYVGKEHADDLLAALTDHYKIENDWEGKLYCHIELRWDYEGGWVNTSMSTYVHHQLVRYDHPLPKHRKRTPYAPAPVVHDKKAQEMPEPENRPLLDAKGKLRVQQVVGSFLYYARAVDLKIVASLSEIASMQAAPTEYMMQKVNNVLD